MSMERRPSPTWKGPWLTAGKLALALILSACSGGEGLFPLLREDLGEPGSVQGALTQPTISAEIESGMGSLTEGTVAFLPLGTVIDDQGAVEVAVTPLEGSWLTNGTLVFEIGMNTHSVDLSMDLSKLATLETDGGLSFLATNWSGGSGHHVTGMLEFDLSSVAEPGELMHIRRWTLILRGIDAPERTFAWYLGAPE